MKRFMIITLSALMLFSAALTGCDKGGNSSSTAPEVTEQSQEQEQTQPPTGIVDVKELSDLTKLHEINYEGDDFAGAWMITDGAGSKLKSFIYQFDGESNLAYLMCGTMGYIATYSVKDDILTARMTFGLNGEYSYKFSEDKMSVVLTNNESNETTTMQKVISYDYIPLPKADAKIDKELLGAWMDDKQEYMYFDENGIMYDTQEGMSFTFYTYSAENGVIDSVYSMPDEIKESREYTIKDGKLSFNGSEFSRISADKLV